MIIKRIFTIYFSATDKTKTVCLALAESLSQKLNLPLEAYDFTLPAGREGFPLLKATDLVIIGVPTYAGRVPNVLLPYLNTMPQVSCHCIPVVTYGNRAFDNSLLELANLCEAKGLKPIAAGAFSAEHSFSLTLGAGRPDKEDLKEIEDFAKAVYAKIVSGDSNCPDIPGDLSAGYFKPADDKKKPINILKVTPLTNDSCVKCGLCAAVCPMGSIDFSDYSALNGICIKCCACIKKCPHHAKYFDDAGYITHKVQLETNFARRGQNSTYL